MGAQSGMLVWGTPWTEKPSRPQFKGPQRVGQSLATKQQEASRLSPAHLKHAQNTSVSRQLGKII